MKNLRHQFQQLVVRIPWLRRWFYVLVYIAGMFPAIDGIEGSGTLVLVYHRDSDTRVLEGLSDTAGELRGWIPMRWIGEKMFFPVREPGFTYDHEINGTVQPWGLFHAVQMTKDQFYIGTKGGRALDPDLYDSWNSGQRNYDAQVLTQAAARHSITFGWWGLLVGAAALSVVVARSFGFSEAIVITIGVAAWLVRTWLGPRAMGLFRRPVPATESE